MNECRLNEQIAFLRRQKRVTQEQLAQALGVTNQAVSKWESGQCCPDIQLLPALADYFSVSLDMLMGRTVEIADADPLISLRNIIEAKENGEDDRYTLKAAYTLHAIILSKCMTAPGTGNPGWDSDDAIEHAGQAEWGRSCVNIPEITTHLRRGTVLFSDNKNFGLSNHSLKQIAAKMRIFGNENSLRTFVALYGLIVHDEKAYTTEEQIVEKSGLSLEIVRECLNGSLTAFLRENEENGRVLWRIDGMYMDLVPLISLMDSF